MGARTDEPTVTVTGMTETRRVMLDSDADRVTGVAVGYVRHLDAAGSPTTPWAVEYAAVHRPGEHDYYVPRLPSCSWHRDLTDAPAWLLRAAKANTPDEATS